MFTVFSDFSTQRSSGEFLASRGLWEEKTYSNLCPFVIALSCWRGSDQGFCSVGLLAKTNIWSPQRVCVWDTPWKLPHSDTHNPPALPQIALLQEQVFGTTLFLLSARLLAPWFKARPTVPTSRSRFWSRPDPGKASWFLCSSSSAHVTNDRWRSCRGSTASLCLLRSRNTFASDARSPETLQSAPTD